MADFKKAIQFVLHNEDPELTGVVTTDDGGRTRFGVAEKFHPHIGDEFYAGPADEALETAEKLYRSDYWQPISGDVIESDAVATKLLDMVVNMGLHQGIVLLQRSLTVKQDGVLGDITLAAVNAADPDALLFLLCEQCANFYHHLAAVRPDTEKYLHDWLARARRIPQEAAEPRSLEATEPA